MFTVVIEAFLLWTMVANATTTHEKNMQQALDDKAVIKEILLLKHPNLETLAIEAIENHVSSIKNALESKTRQPKEELDNISFTTPDKFFKEVFDPLNIIPKEISKEKREEWEGLFKNSSRKLFLYKALLEMLARKGALLLKKDTSQGGCKVTPIPVDAVFSTEIIIDFLHDEIKDIGEKDIRLLPDHADEIFMSMGDIISRIWDTNSKEVISPTIETLDWINNSFNDRNIVEQTKRALNSIKDTDHVTNKKDYNIMVFFNLFEDFWCFLRNYKDFIANIDTCDIKDEYTKYIESITNIIGALFHVAIKPENTENFINTVRSEYSKIPDSTQTQNNGAGKEQWEYWNVMVMVLIGAIILLGILICYLMYISMRK